MKTLEEHEEELISNYEEMFLRRGEFTPTDPLEFHLFHLATYWSRLMGFCRLHPDHPEVWLDGGLGALVKIGSGHASDFIDPASEVFASWTEYKKLADTVLHYRPVSLGNVEAASEAFDRCVSALNQKQFGQLHAVWKRQ